MFSGKRRYNAFSAKFPTLYRQHGYSGTHTDWLYNGHAAELAGMRRIAIVMPEYDNFWLIS